MDGAEDRLRTASQARLLITKVQLMVGYDDGMELGLLMSQMMSSELATRAESIARIVEKARALIRQREVRLATYASAAEGAEAGGVTREDSNR